MIKIKLFDGKHKDLVAYNGQALLNWQIIFTIDVCDNDPFTEDEEPFTFPFFISAYFRVYNERLGTKIKDITPSLSGSTLVFNTYDMMFEDNGDYYYEVGYVQTGGYDIVLMYGTLNIK